MREITELLNRTHSLIGPIAPLLEEKRVTVWGNNQASEAQLFALCCLYSCTCLGQAWNVPLEMAGLRGWFDVLFHKQKIRPFVDLYDASRYPPLTDLLIQVRPMNEDRASVMKSLWLSQDKLVFTINTDGGIDMKRS